MRIVITSLGSVGDVQPFVALAVEFQRHGHQIVFALPTSLVRYPQRLGFSSVQLGPDLREYEEELIRIGIRGEQFSDEQWIAVWTPLIAAMPEALRQLCALCAEADLLISASTMPLGRIAHDLTGIPFVAIRPSFFTPAISAIEEDQHVFVAVLNQLRVQLGLAPMAPTDTGRYSPQLTLFPMSRRILPPEPDWPAHYHVTGFFFLDEPGWQPDPALAAFLATGPAPVLISLGSMMHDDPAALTRRLLAAIDQVGCRALLHQGWSGLGQDAPLPAHVFAIGYTPYDQLLPRTAGMVHHGGAGTTAAVFRAGVPAVVIPHFLASDQFDLGRCAQELGCAPEPIPFAELSVERLSAALRELLANPQYQRAATALAESIRAEQGVQTARLLIEELVASLSQPATRG
jgi:UDP:flavonoid glycosyltransferase YjiC (YdhE family)